MSVASITRDQERAVEQRTRIRDCRFVLRGIANDGEPPPAEIETELRDIDKRLQRIETELGALYAVRRGPK